MRSHVIDYYYQSSHGTLKAPESIGFIVKEDYHWGTYIIHSYMSNKVDQFFSSFFYKTLITNSKYTYPEHNRYQDSTTYIWQEHPIVLIDYYHPHKRRDTDLF